MRPSIRRDRDRIVRKTVLFGGAVVIAASMAAADIAAASTSSTAAPSIAQYLRSTQDDALDTQVALKDMLLADGPDSSVGAYPRSVRQQLLSFYEKRAFRPAWTGGAAERERATEVLSALARADDQGLRAPDYASPAQWGGEPTASKKAAEYDVVLTEAVLRYARDVSIGRVRPHQVYEDAQLPVPHFDAVQVVARMLDGGSMSAALAELPPAHAEYQRLAQALARYRDIAMRGGWPSLPADGVTNLENNNSRVGLLLRRLALEDPALAAIANPSGADLRDAVKRFQARNSLAVDGRVTMTTLAALNVPVSNRIEQIRANMERWRWLPRTFEDRYISVNVPDQKSRLRSQWERRAPLTSHRRPQTHADPHPANKHWRNSRQSSVGNPRRYRGESAAAKAAAESSSFGVQQYGSHQRPSGGSPRCQDPLGTGVRQRISVSRRSKSRTGQRARAGDAQLAQ